VVKAKRGETYTTSNSRTRKIDDNFAGLKLFCSFNKTKNHIFIFLKVNQLPTIMKKIILLAILVPIFSFSQVANHFQTAEGTISWENVY
jgi:hypothetical protein